MFVSDIRTGQSKKDRHMRDGGGGGGGGAGSRIKACDKNNTYMIYTAKERI